MKVSFLSENLSQKISFLGRAVSQRGQLPILSNFLLVAKGGKLKISATDLEIGISITFPVNVEKEGSATVPARNFSDLIQNLGNQKITLTEEGGILKLVGEKVKASFQTMSHEDFPNLYEEKGQELLTVKKSDLQKSIGRVVFSAAVESARPALSGVLIEDNGKEIVFVAADGYRLSLQKNALKTKEGLKRPLVVPNRIIKEMLSSKEDSEDVRFFVSEKNSQIIFEQGDTIIVGRLIDAEFPEYEKIIPQDFSTRIEIDKEDLLSAIKVSSVFARETANVVKFSVEKEKLIVSANSPSVGEDSVEVPVKSTGEENEIAFNAKYLLDFLSIAGEDLIVFEMTGPLNPGVFKIKEDNSFLHLIMPITVSVEN